MDMLELTRLRTTPAGGEHGRRSEMDMLERFMGDVAEHEMTVLHDDGLYRHVRFKKPDTIGFYFDLITWPGHLTVAGDMGTYTFRRLPDMFDFFTSPTINAQYWAEKTGGAAGVEQYSPRLFRQRVTEAYDEHVQEDPGAEHLGELWDRIVDCVLDRSDEEREALAAAGAFSDPNFEFYDSWEWHLTDYTFHFLWCCHAIRWGVEKYKASIPAVAETEAAL